MTKKLLAAAISSALVIPMAAQAVEYKISGHVNRMIRFADNGAGSDVQHVDNSASRSRFRFVGSGDVGNGMKAGIYIETSVASEAANNQNIKVSASGGNDTRFDLRHSALWFSGNWGKVTLGHTSTASDCITCADLSGTQLIDEWPTVVDYMGGLTFNPTNVPAAALGPVSLGAVFSTFDGGRNDVLRYDSPALGPATIAVSHSQNEYWDAAVFIDHQVAGGALQLNGGYIHAGNAIFGANAPSNPGAGGANGSDQWAVSGSFKFSQGTSISAMYGQGEVNELPTGVDYEGEGFFAKLGHAWGSNAVSVSYGEVSHEGTIPGAKADTELTTWGVGFVHTIKKPGIELYAGYHNMDLEVTLPGVNPNFDDIDVFAVGSRVKFQ